MADFQLKGPISIAVNANSGIIQLDPARDWDIAATIIIGGLAAADVIFVDFIQCASATLPGSSTNVSEDPATVFADADRVATSKFASPDAAAWSLNAVIPGRYTHMRIRNPAGNSKTVKATMLY